MRSRGWPRAHGVVCAHAALVLGRSARSEDYSKTIQVGPNIQFIYRLNVCTNTLVKCQGQDAPATEVGAGAAWAARLARC